MTQEHFQEEWEYFILGYKVVINTSSFLHDFCWNPTLHLKYWICAPLPSWAKGVINKIQKCDLLNSEHLGIADM